MDWDFIVFVIVRAVAIVIMAQSFHCGIKERNFWKSLVFWLFALAVLDLVISLEDLRP